MNQADQILEIIRKRPLSIEQAKSMGIVSMSARISRLRARGCVITCDNNVYKLVSEPLQEKPKSKKARMKTALDIVMNTPGCTYNEIRITLGIAQKSRERYALLADLDALVSQGKIRTTRDAGRNNYWPPYNCDVLLNLYAPKPKLNVKGTRHVSEKPWKSEHKSVGVGIQSPFSYVTFGM